MIGEMIEKSMPGKMDLERDVKHQSEQYRKGSRENWALKREKRCGERLEKVFKK